MGSEVGVTNRWSLVVCAGVAFLCGACGDSRTVETNDGGAPGDDGSMPVIDGSASDAAVSCDVVDRVCPGDAPYPSAPCEGELTCTYPDELSGERRMMCNGGHWEDTSVCIGCPPPLAETCREPFAGTLSGATVQLLDPASSAPFTEGQTIAVMWGGQGGAMIAHRMRIAGADAPPSCVTATQTIAIDGIAGPPVSRMLALRCGDTLTVFSLIESPCESRMYEIDLDVDVEGVGTAHASLRLMGGMCPRGGETG